MEGVEDVVSRYTIQHDHFRLINGRINIFFLIEIRLKIIILFGFSEFLHRVCERREHKCEIKKFNTRGNLSFFFPNDLEFQSFFAYF